MRRGRRAADVAVLAERQAVVAEHEHGGVVRHLVEQLAELVVHGLHVLHVGLAHAVDLAVAETRAPRAGRRWDRGRPPRRARASRRRAARAYASAGSNGSTPTKNESAPSTWRSARMPQAHGAARGVGEALERGEQLLVDARAERRPLRPPPARRTSCEALARRRWGCRSRRSSRCRRRASASIRSGWWSHTGLKPGTDGKPSSRRQSRNGKARMPVTSARRADSAGIDSGIARSKRSDFFVSSFRFGVFAGAPPSNASTWSARTSGSTTSSAPRPRSSPELGGGRPAAASEPSTPAPAARRAAAAQQAPARERHPPITALPVFRPNCGSVPPASSSRMRQYLSTSSGCSVGHVHELLRVLPLVVEALAEARAVGDEEPVEVAGEHVVVVAGGEVRPRRRLLAVEDDRQVLAGHHAGRPRAHERERRARDVVRGGEVVAPLARELALGVPDHERHVVDVPVAARGVLADDPVLAERQAVVRRVDDHRLVEHLLVGQPVHQAARPTRP